MNQKKIDKKYINSILHDKNREHIKIFKTIIKCMF